ncbi:hypothetical protein SARC_16203, partial [Sphaeroforma arctica JP610]
DAFTTTLAVALGVTDSSVNITATSEGSVKAYLAITSSTSELMTEKVTAGDATITDIGVMSVTKNEDVIINPAYASTTPGAFVYHHYRLTFWAVNIWKE